MQPLTQSCDALAPAYVPRCECCASHIDERRRAAGRHCEARHIYCGDRDQTPLRLCEIDTYRAGAGWGATVRLPDVPNKRCPWDVAQGAYIASAGGETEWIAYLGACRAAVAWRERQVEP